MKSLTRQFNVKLINQVFWNLFPYLSTAMLYFLLNVPLFTIGWKYVGRRFFLYSLAGMAILDGHGGYSGQKENVLYTVISFHELSRLKQLIRMIDSKTFVVVNDTLEVMGHKIGNQPQW